MGLQISKPARQTLTLFVSIAAAVAGAGAIAPGALAADSLQISIASPAPEQGVPMAIQFAGSSETVDSEGHGPDLYAVIRPTGGIGCQSNYKNDHSAAGGVTTDLVGPSFSESSNNPEGPGAYDQSVTYDPTGVGSYLICAWLQNGQQGSETLAGPVSTTLTTRGPQVYQLAVGLPSAPLPNVAFEIDYTTHTDQQLTLSSTIRPAGGLPCAANAKLDSEQNQNETSLFPSYENENVFGGPITTKQTTTEKAGAYVICAWIEGPGSEEVDAMSSTGIYVGTPPHPALPPPAPSDSCLRDRSRVAGEELHVRTYERKLRTRRLSRRTRRKYDLILARDRGALSKYESERRAQCPNGR